MKCNYDLTLFSTFLIGSLSGALFGNRFIPGKHSFPSKAFTVFDESLNITRDSHSNSVEMISRQYHRCVSEQIPYVSDVLESAQYLLYHSTTSFARFGDGELKLMNNHSCRFQHAEHSLSEALLRVFTSEHKSLMIGLPNIFSGYAPINKGGTRFWDRHKEHRQWFITHAKMDKQYLNSHLTAIFSNAPKTCLLLRQTYDTLRDIWRDKDIILLRGNNSQKYEYDVYDTARSVKVLFAPRYEAWRAYRNLKQILVMEDPERLYILAAGPVSKVLALDLAESGRRALDLGHLAKDYDAYRKGKRLKDFYLD